MLVANELGIYALIADAMYASGMAATGGSVALRIQGASSAVDAAGWGTAASSWMEGAPAPAPAAGSSLERLPGGMLGRRRTPGRTRRLRGASVPDPQNAASPPVPVLAGTPLADARRSPTQTPPPPTDHGRADAVGVHRPTPTP